MRKPVVLGIGPSDSTDAGYHLRYPYLNGAEVICQDEAWVTADANGSVPPPKEYRHTLGALVGALAESGSVIDADEESTHRAPEAEPGSWEHFTSFAPPWIGYSVPPPTRCPPDRLT